MNARLLIACLISFTINVRALDTQDTGGQGNLSGVSVESVHSVKSNSIYPLTEVKLKLDVKHLTSVYIDGVGEVSSDAKVSYVTSESRLVVRGDLEGSSFVDRDLELGMSLTSTNPDLDFPSEREFTFDGGQGPSPTSLRFSSVQGELLNSVFHFPPEKYVRAGKAISITRYRRLDSDDDVLFVEVAAQVSYPAQIKNNKAGFELKYTAREKRKNSGWRSELSPEASKAASAFIGDLHEKLVKCE